MQNLKKKLNSKAGSSLFLAIVFFLFTFFVGGTVLAAATANGGRIANLKRDRGEYYTQRSAALMLQEMMRQKTPEGDSAKLTLLHEQTQPMRAENPNKASDLKVDINKAPTNTLTAQGGCPNLLQEKMAKILVQEIAAQLNTGGGITDNTDSGDRAQTGTVTIENLTADYDCQVELSDPDKPTAVITFSVRPSEANAMAHFQVKVPAKISLTRSQGARDAKYQENALLSNGTYGRLYTITNYTQETYSILLDEAIITKMSRNGGDGV